MKKLETDTYKASILKWHFLLKGKELQYYYKMLNMVLDPKKDFLSEVLQNQ